LTLIIADELPSNDECISATEVIGASFQETTHTAGANSSPSDPVQECVGTTRKTNSVWYEFASAMDVSVTVDTVGSDYDTVLSAYRGTCADLEPLACDDDTEERASRVRVPVAAGETILFQITDFSSQPGGGNLRLRLETGAPLPTPTPGPSPTPTRNGCAGDCDGNSILTIHEVVMIVNIALGIGRIDSCKAADTDLDKTVTINEIVRAIDNAIDSCRTVIQ
jgi:hypothetical protein